MTLLGCTLEPLDHDAVTRAIAEATGAAPATPSYRWLLAHCDSGVVWGRREGERWLLSGAAFPDTSPPLDTRSIQQLRLFGPRSELLVWRTRRDPEPQFRGRALSDVDAPREHRPLSDRIILIGDRLLATSGGFSLVGDATGSRHAVPFLCRDEDFVDASGAKRSPLRLRVRHYLAEVPARAAGEESSGALRIAATRLCGIVLHDQEVQ